MTCSGHLERMAERAAAGAISAKDSRDGEHEAVHKAPWPGLSGIPCEAGGLNISLPWPW